MRRAAGSAAIGALALTTALVVAPTTATASAQTSEYLVLVADGQSRADAVAAVVEAGGRVVGENPAIGSLKVLAPASGFVAEVSRSSAVEGATSNRLVGRRPSDRGRGRDVEREHLATRAGGTSATARATAATSVGMDPLDERLWGLRMVRSDKARTVQPGKAAVKVGIIDTGIDARNPDIAPNFDATLSRNFVTDLPSVDGPCEFPGCKDPANWDDDGHGTHVAGTVGAAANGFGISGVAPKVSLVNVRAGHDAGYFFVGPVTDALTYAGDARLDVVNMSFYVDPWLYNCIDNPDDSPTAQAEQRATIKAMRRALTYAHAKGVTLVGALGNNHEDLGNPRDDISSPNFPTQPGYGDPYPRDIDNDTCFDLPAEGPHVIGVAALGPSGKKADYSNYGVERNDVSAPGGYYRDYVGTDRFQVPGNLIFSAAPINALQAQGLVDDKGTITPDGEGFVVKSCPTGVTDLTRCGWYQYLQGTSMASPHAAGVAALIVSEYGRGRGARFGLDPDTTRRILFRSARDQACPNPRTVDYLDEGRDETYTATCTGGREFNGFSGHGLVDAYRAVTLR